MLAACGSAPFLSRERFSVQLSPPRHRKWSGGTLARYESRLPKKEDLSAFVLGAYTLTIVKGCLLMEKVREAKYPFTISLKETKVKGRVCRKKRWLSQQSDLKDY